MIISLKSIDQSNWEECIELQVWIAQLWFVAQNIRSLAEYSVTPNSEVLWIYQDDKMVWFVMLIQDKQNYEYEIHRFMIDFQYQWLGIWKQAIQEILQYIQSKPKRWEKVKLMFLLENIFAEKFYKSCWFVDTQKTEYNQKWRFTEKIYTYTFTS